MLIRNRSKIKKTLLIRLEYDNPADNRNVQIEEGAKVSIQYADHRSRTHRKVLGKVLSIDTRRVLDRPNNIHHPFDRYADETVLVLDCSLQYGANRINVFVKDIEDIEVVNSYAVPEGYTLGYVLSKDNTDTVYVPNVEGTYNVFANQDGKQELIGTEVSKATIVNLIDTWIDEGVLKPYIFKMNVIPKEDPVPAPSIIIDAEDEDIDDIFENNNSNVIIDTGNNGGDSGNTESGSGGESGSGDNTAEDGDIDGIFGPGDNSGSGSEPDITIPDEGEPIVDDDLDNTTGGQTATDDDLDNIFDGDDGIDDDF